MREAKVERHLEERQLLPQAVLPLAQRIDSTPHCCHTLADVQVEPFDEGGVDLPAAGRKQLFNAFHRAEYQSVLDGHDAPAPVRLHHLDIKQLWQGIQRGFELGPFTSRRDGWTHMPKCVRMAVK
jgi:hypothetical protein